MSYNQSVMDQDESLVIMNGHSDSNNLQSNKILTIFIRLLFRERKEYSITDDQERHLLRRIEQVLEEERK